MIVSLSDLCMKAHEHMRRIQIKEQKWPRWIGRINGIYSFPFDPNFPDTPRELQIRLDEHILRECLLGQIAWESILVLGKNLFLNNGDSADDAIYLICRFHL